MNGSHVRTVSAVVDVGARRRAARNPATAGQVAAMIVSSRPCGSLERQARMMSRWAEASMSSRIATATRENTHALPNPSPARVSVDQTSTMIVRPTALGSPRTRRPTTIAETGVTGFQ